MPAAGVVLIVAVVLIVLALVYYLVSTIVALRQITGGLDEAIGGVGELIEKTRAGRRRSSTTINANLDAAVDALEGLLVKKAGLRRRGGPDRRALPGRRRARACATSPTAATITPPRISEVYTQGTLTLARLGREAPIAAASPNGPVLRNVIRSGSRAARCCTPRSARRARSELPRSPVIGTDSPVQYEPSETPGVRARMPATPAGTRAATN